MSFSCKKRTGIFQVRGTLVGLLAEMPEMLFTQVAQKFMDT